MHLSSSTLTPPLKWKGVSWMLSVDNKLWNWVLWRTLVKMLASWSTLRMYRTSSFRCKTLSLMKWASISMCLVLAWKIGLVARCPILMLSHQIMGAEKHWQCNSFNRDCYHVSFAVQCTSAWYFDLVLNRSTIFCFLEDHETRFSPKNTQ